jgi:hypothetical protein
MVKKKDTEKAGIYSLLHERVHLLRAIDFHVCDIFCWEADVEVFVLVLVCHVAGPFVVFF